MDGQVFLVDSGYLNRFMVAIQKNNANGKMNSNCLDASYPRDCTEDSVGLTAYENGEIKFESHEDSESLVIDGVSNETNLFVTCVKDEVTVMQHIDHSLSPEPLESMTDSDVNNIENAIPIKAYTVNKSDDQYSTSAPFRYVNNSITEPQNNILLKAKSRLDPLEKKSKVVYNSFVSKKKEVVNYADERYYLYSNSKNYLRKRTSAKKDAVTMIPPKIFKRQLMDASDTLKPILKMPATKLGMQYLERTVSSAFSRPAASTCSRMMNIFTRNCCTHHEPDEQKIDDIGLMPIGFQKTIDKSKIKRISRKRKNTSAKVTDFQKILQNIQPQRTPSIETDPIREYILPHAIETCEDDSLLIPHSSEDHLQTVYVDSQQEECFLYSGECEDEPQQIILIHDEGDQQTEGVEEDDGGRNIRVLLAAAAEQQLPTSNFFICRDSSETDQNCLQTPHSVFYVENTYSEETSSS